MGEEFSRPQQSEVPATPDEVWEAIATGPGVDSWFLGRNDVEPGVGGAFRTDMEGIPDSEVTAWEPGRRLAYGSAVGDDGRFVAYEFLIEGREGSATVIRFVTSGFLPGDDWSDEHEAMGTGLELFFRTLVEYLHHFRGRAATPVSAFGTSSNHSPMEAIHRALGLADPVVGGRARLTLDEEVVEGVVYHLNRDTIGVRTDEAMYRFIAGLGGSTIASHHLFSTNVDSRAERDRWRAWLDETEEQ